jgi:hypothetical protein
METMTVTMKRRKKRITGAEEITKRKEMRKGSEWRS